MNTHHARDLALKVLGLYYLAQAIIGAAGVAGMYVPGSNFSEPDMREWVTISWVAPLLFSVGIGLMLTLRTDWVLNILWRTRGDESPMVVSLDTPLSFWIVLVGFLYVVHGIVGTIEALSRIVPELSTTPSVGYPLLPQLAALALGVLCILKATQIEALLKRKSGASGQIG